MRDLDDWGGLPEWARENPDRAADFAANTWTRAELMTLIGRRVGFEHDPDHDRLRKEELARILIYITAMTGEL